MPKPASPVFNPSHPLAAGLLYAWTFHEGTGNALPVNGAVGGAMTAQPSAGWTTDPDGRPCLRSVGVAGFTAPVTFPGSLPGLTYFWRGRNTAPAQTSTYLIDYKNYSIIYGYAGTRQYESFHEGTFTRTSIGSLADADTATHSLAISVTTGGYRYRAFDGAIAGPNLYTLAIGATGSGTLYLANVTAVGYHAADHDCLYIWGRGLDPSELAAIHADPWQFVTPTATPTERRRPRAQLLTGGIGL